MALLVGGGKMEAKVSLIRDDTNGANNVAPLLFLER